LCRDDEDENDGQDRENKGEHAHSFTPDWLKCKAGRSDFCDLT
jgi:hypothetical protein